MGFSLKKITKAVSKPVASVVKATVVKPAAVAVKVAVKASVAPVVAAAKPIAKVTAKIESNPVGKLLVKPLKIAEGPTLLATKAATATVARVTQDSWAKQANAAVSKQIDSTIKDIKSAGRDADRAMGGAQGWGKTMSVTGSAVALIPTPWTQAAGAALAVGGAALAKKGAADDAAREKKKAEEAAKAAATATAAAASAAASSAGAAMAPKTKRGLLARILGWLRGEKWGA